MNPRIYLVAITGEEWLKLSSGTSLRRLMEVGLSLERRIAGRVRLAEDRQLYDRTCRTLEEVALLACETGVGRKRMLQYQNAVAYMALAARLSDWRHANLASFTASVTEAHRREAEWYKAHRPEPMGKSFYPQGFPVQQQWSFFSAITEQYAAALLARHLPNVNAAASDLAAAARIKARFIEELPDGAALIEAATLEPY